jgi:shikimate kinase
LAGADKNIVLTGFMAAGKTAVGRRLAERLGRPFFDLDRVVEERAGLAVPEIFERFGEAHFRRLEKEALLELVASGGKVIATGGGAVIDRESRARLRERTILICLSARPEVLARRAESEAGRPLLEGHDRLERVRALLQERADAYAAAHATIDTSALAVEEVVERILEYLAGR